MKRNRRSRPPLQALSAFAGFRLPVVRRRWPSSRSPALANVIAELIPAAFHNSGQYENNRRECDHGRLKARLRPVRELLTDRTAGIVIRGHANIWNLRRGHYELGVETVPARPPIA